MNLLEFIVGMVGALVWPTFFFILIIMFRSEFKILLDRIESIKHKDTEVKLRELASKIERGGQDEEVSEGADVEKKLVEIDPALAVVKTWSEFEGRSRDYLERNGIKFNKRISDIIEKLYDRKVLNSYDMSIIKDAKVIRNMGAHGEGYNISEKVARQIIEYLQDIIKKLD